ncbi:trypsin-like peptidase domain-containing protein [Robiginitomaculum antarcticum]|uniref:trypsin-like peptidase domain-containing protein n=1 Tax=Robiginitomaculum antarcticum TaxID=437507 RepID=UPI00039A8206|nr:trypsin-like peptidase domain-containing protein [Robiginitomaculum antarcticum]
MYRGIVENCRWCRFFITLLTCLVVASIASAQDINPSEITVSTNLKPLGNFEVSQISDGIEITPYPAGFAVSSSQAVNGNSGYVDFRFNNSFDIRAAKIWNGLDGPIAGFRSIRFEFFDNRGVNIYDYPSGPLNIDPNNQNSQSTNFDINKPKNIDRVRLWLLDPPGGELGIREVTFIGTASPPPVLSNRPPVGYNQNLMILTDRTDGNFLNYASDPDRDRLSVINVKSTPQIPFGYGRDGNFNITFPKNGNYLITFTVSDGRGGNRQVNITYNVTGVPSSKISNVDDPTVDDPYKWLYFIGTLLLAVPLLFIFLRKIILGKPVNPETVSSAVLTQKSWWIPPIVPAGQALPKPERPPEAGVVFADSPLLAGAVAPGPAPLAPMGQMVPSGLQTLTGQYAVLKPAYLATGRIGGRQEGIPTNDDVSFGTGFLITPSHIMTNQHVYEFYKQYLTGPDCGGIEFIAERDRDASDYVPFNGDPPLIISNLDVAIFTLSRSVTDRTPIERVSIPTDELNTREVVSISYPCPFEVNALILSVVEDDPVFAVKRISQGRIFRHSTDTDTPYGVEVSVEPRINPSKKLMAICHNASTLGGSSGAPILDMDGQLVGLHFAGDRTFNGEEAANLAMAIDMLVNANPARDQKLNNA